MSRGAEFQLEADPARSAKERQLQLARELVALLEADLGRPPEDAFVTWQRAAPLMGMTLDAAKKRAQREGEKLGGKLGFRRSYISIYRESMGWSPA